MADYIETPTMGEILNDEFFIPLGLSAYKVAKEIKTNKKIIILFFIL